MSEIEVLNEFKNQLINFFDELISQFPNEGDLVIVRLFFSNQCPIQDAMNVFIKKIEMNNQQLRNMIKERNEKFFLEHNVFEGLDENKTSHFKKIWLSGNLDDEDKKIIWNWVDVFVYLADKYIKAKQ